MSNDTDLSRLGFMTLTEAKTKLSEVVRRAAARRMVITSNGLPAAVLMDYQDYLRLAQAGSTVPAPQRVIDFEEWMRDAPQRREAAQSIKRLFGADSLQRKGQKDYKRKRVRRLEQSLAKKTG